MSQPHSVSLVLTPIPKQHWTRKVPPHFVWQPFIPALCLSSPAFAQSPSSLIFPSSVTLVPKPHSQVSHAGRNIHRHSCPCHAVLRPKSGHGESPLTPSPLTLSSPSQSFPSLYPTQVPPRSNLLSNSLFPDNEFLSGTACELVSPGSGSGGWSGGVSGIGRRGGQGRRIGCQGRCGPLNPHDSVPSLTLNQPPSS